MTPSLKRAVLGSATRSSACRWCCGGWLSVLLSGSGLGGDDCCLIGGGIKENVAGFGLLVQLPCFVLSLLVRGELLSLQAREKNPAPTAPGGLVCGS